MYDNYNYPLGADNSSAPWNEKENEPKEFQCTVSVTLEKTMKIETSCYNEYWEKDDDGTPIHEIDTDDVDWNDEYKENHITLIEMLEELEGYVRQDLSMTGANTKKGRHLKELLKACRGWEETETDVYES